MSNILRAILVIAIPAVAFLGGGYVMGKLSGHDEVERQSRSLSKEDQKGLGLRIGGYDLEAVARRWGVLDPAGLSAEQRMLEMDLVFPFLYGGAFAASLLLTWAALGRPFNPIWLIAPVAINVLADWTENLIQLSQLHRFESNKIDGLQAPWIQIASAATTTKVVCFSASYFFVIALALWLVGRAISSRT